MTVHGSYPHDDPHGIVLKLWNFRGAIELTEDELADVEDLLRWIRKRLAADGPIPMEGRRR